MATDFSNLNLKIEYLPIDSLKPYERNAKEHPAKPVEQIKRSILQNGMNDPIGIWGAKNTVVEGHGRLMACKELGYETVPVIRLDHLTDEQRREYALIHNQTTMNSGWDFPVLDAELTDLPDFDAEFFGFEMPDELDLTALDAEDDTDEKTVVRVVFQTYKEYRRNEEIIKEFVQNIGATMTVGK